MISMFHPLSVDRQLPGILRHLSVQDDPTALVDPKILFHQTAVLSEKETVRETDQTVRG